MCDMTPSHVWHDSFIHVIWLLYMCDMTPVYSLYDSLSVCMTWLFLICDMTPSYVWHASFICVTWLLHMWDMTPAYVPPLTMCLCVMRLLHIYEGDDSFIYDIIHSYKNYRFLLQKSPIKETYDSFIHICHKSLIKESNAWLRHARDMTLSYVWRDSLTRATP